MPRTSAAVVPKVPKIKREDHATKRKAVKGGKLRFCAYSEDCEVPAQVQLSVSTTEYTIDSHKACIVLSESGDRKSQTVDENINSEVGIR